MGATLKSHAATVLIIEDDAEMCSLFSRVLERDGFRVAVAHNGVDGLSKADITQPDLVLLDVMMPGIDGWETYRRLRKKTPIPILFLTAKTDMKSIANGLGLGASDYLCKPIHIRELSERVSAVLSYSTATAANLGKVKEIPILPQFALKRSLLSLKSYESIKSVIDLLSGIVGSLLTLLIYLPLGIIIKLDSPGPVLFKQVRIGRCGDPFTILKFRTMSEASPAYMQNGQANIEAHVTRVGKILRKLLLDELPQFINVLRGEMSLVGPRPELPNIVASYVPREYARLMVKPGITGWWQINGRRQPMKAFTRVDIDYVEHRSLAFDLYIVYMTFGGPIHRLLFADKYSNQQRETPWELTEESTDYHFHR